MVIHSQQSRAKGICKEEDTNIVKVLNSSPILTPVSNSNSYIWMNFIVRDVLSMIWLNFFSHSSLQGCLLSFAALQPPHFKIAKEFKHKTLPSDDKSILYLTFEVGRTAYLFMLDRARRVNVTRCDKRRSSPGVPQQYVQPCFKAMDVGLVLSVVLCDLFKLSLLLP